MVILIILAIVLIWWLVTYYQKQAYDARKIKESAEKKKAEEERMFEAGMKDLAVQMDELPIERAAAEAAEDLAPEEIDGKKRKYHYKDVEIVVFWQYGGRYEKSLESEGVKRGDPVRLKHSPTEEDPERVVVVWNDQEIGEMKPNRMRNMVLSWQEAGYPIFSAVNGLYKWHKAFFEIAFYGYVRRNTKLADSETEE